MPDPSLKTRRIVCERDDWCCLGCAQDVRHMYWWSLQHRKARGVGGGNGPENLVVLCGSATSQGCHLLCEQRSVEMVARGLVVPSWNNPSEIPVVLPSGRAVYLSTDGQYLDRQEAGT